MLQIQRSKRPVMQQEGAMLLRVPCCCGCHAAAGAMLPMLLA
jgi:hypothetical protein